jgi:DNA-binding transcriptional MerR regulator/methylmalonyl-CoA mutase cobalamin-binding subunit
MLPISTVEHETGLTKDTLRKWEARYGFPQPTRKPNGERLYYQSDLDRLLVIKRLLDNGSRPASIVPLSIKKLNALASEQFKATAVEGGDEILDQVWQALIKHAPSDLKSALERGLTTNGLDKFVLAIMPALNRMAGDGWAKGSLSVHQEHLYSETIRNLLLEAIGRLRPLPGRPRVLLSTPPEERHNLGMLMAQSIFASSGAECICLGTETPANELSAAALSHRVQIVALSFSIAFPSRRIAPFLEQVRASLPDSIHLWAGGAGVDRLRRKMPGIHWFASLELASSALATFPDVRHLSN